MEVGIYAPVSTRDRQALHLQLKGMLRYACKRRRKITQEVEEIGSGAI